MSVTLGIAYCCAYFKLCQFVSRYLALTAYKYPKYVGGMGNMIASGTAGLDILIRLNKCSIYCQSEA